ncbi:hypothetical protein ACFLZI_01465 [Nitrospirota bacterium]
MADISKAGPYLINEDATGKSLYPLPPKEKHYQEKWLQALIEKHPAILPVDELDERYAPLVSAGREILNIDNLLISPNGLITIVETKLWRNPEAHRQVVAQVLDYARTLSKWSYKDLEKAVLEYQQKLGDNYETLHMFMKAHSSKTIASVDFQAEVQNSLENGKFALLIVGDKIYPAVTELAETIQSAPHMQYSMGFVELKCYRTEKGKDWPLMIVPTYVAKTKEITRAVVKVIFEEKKPEVITSTPDDKSPSSRTSFPEFVTSLPEDITEHFKGKIEHWMQQSDYTVYWGVVGFSLRIPVNGKLETFFDAYPTYASILMEKYADQYKIPSEAYQRYKQDLMRSQIFLSTFSGNKRYIYFDKMTIEEVVQLLEATDKLVSSMTKLQAD